MVNSELFWGRFSRLNWTKASSAAQTILFVIHSSPQAVFFTQYVQLSNQVKVLNNANQRNILKMKSAAVPGGSLGWPLTSTPSVNVHTETFRILILMFSFTRLSVLTLSPQRDKWGMLSEKRADGTILVSDKHKSTVRRKPRSATWD